MSKLKSAVLSILALAKDVGRIFCYHFAFFPAYMKPADVHRCASGRRPHWDAYSMRSRTCGHQPRDKLYLSAVKAPKIFYIK
jgi:hypothetical protein